MASGRNARGAEALARRVKSSVCTDVVGVLDSARRAGFSGGVKGIRSVSVRAEIEGVLAMTLTPISVSASGMRSIRQNVLKPNLE